MTTTKVTKRKQKVHLGRTQSGVPGLFTGNTLAFKLSEQQFTDYSKDRELLSQFIATFRGEFVLERSMIEGAAFALETIAHLQGHERMLLPFAEHLREADRLLKELLDGDVLAVDTVEDSNRDEIRTKLNKALGVWEAQP